MKVIVDAMGGDNAPLEIVRGALNAHKNHGTGILLVGRTAEVLKAVEACGQVASPFIRLEAGLRKDYLVVTESNPAPADDTRKERRIPQLERGIGLHILTDLAGRYHGSCTQEVRDGQFTVSIALQLPENQGETEEA